MNALRELPTLPLALAGSTHPTLRSAWERFAQVSAAGLDTPPCGDILERYDFAGIERVACICFWGRSGSFLLASYLDAHPETLALPLDCAAGIYPFAREFAALNVWEKLIVYPSYVAERYGAPADLFQGGHAIAPARYYGAVQALHTACAALPLAQLAGRRRFFQLLHVAYALALGRTLSTNRPLVVYAQHATDDALAQLLHADFPECRFLHTVRDPISAVDSWFERQQQLQLATRGGRLEGARFVHPGTETLRTLLSWDRPHHFQEERTRAVRFEDLHLAPEATMRRVAEWLGLSFAPSLLASTFNGRPFVWQNGARSWVGANPANAQRRSRNLNAADRALVCALFRDDIRAWGYPVAPWLESRAGCTAMLMLGLFLYMRIERITAATILRRQLAPALRAGKLLYVARGLKFLVMLRARMLRLLVRAARRPRDRALLRPLQSLTETAAADSSAARVPSSSAARGG